MVDRFIVFCVAKLVDTEWQLSRKAFRISDIVSIEDVDDVSMIGSDKPHAQLWLRNGDLVFIMPYVDDAVEEINKVLSM